MLDFADIIVLNKFDHEEPKMTGETSASRQTKRKLGCKDESLPVFEPSRLIQRRGVNAAYRHLLTEISAHNGVEYSSRIPLQVQSHPITPAHHPSERNNYLRDIVRTFAHTTRRLKPQGCTPSSGSADAAAVCQKPAAMHWSRRHRGAEGFSLITRRL